MIKAMKKIQEGGVEYSVYKEGCGCIKWKNSIGELHREDGPAVICCVNTVVKCMWYKNGARHREDGPAVEWENGHTRYFLYDSYISSKNLFLIALGDKVTYIKGQPHLIDGRIIK